MLNPRLSRSQEVFQRRSTVLPICWAWKLSIVAAVAATIVTGAADVLLLIRGSVSVAATVAVFVRVREAADASTVTRTVIAATWPFVSVPTGQETVRVPALYEHEPFDVIAET